MAHLMLWVFAIFDSRGDVVKVKKVIDRQRVLIGLRADEERVVEVSALVNTDDLRFGDSVLLNRVSGILMENYRRTKHKI